MGFNLGSGCLMTFDHETGETHKLGEIGEWTSVESEQEPVGEKLNRQNTFTGSFETTVFNPKLFEELSANTTPESFDIEWKTKILTQARRHRKLRINKKWLKRYGYKEDVVKTVAHARIDWGRI